MNKEKAKKITEKIISMYRDANGSLNFTTPFEILVAVSLSAQCKDDTVNKVTSVLFKKYDTPEDFANAKLEDIEEIIHPCGFYKNKAKNLINAGKKIVKDFNGKVPETMEELIQIPGVGRKSANIIMLEGFNKPMGIAVDTHVKRISKRLGFSKEEDPSKIEQDLLKLIPKKYWKDVNHKFIEFGRNICSSQSPKCNECPFTNECLYYKNISKH